MVHSFAFPRPRSPQLWALGAFLVLTFLVGGAARSDVKSLVLLRPISVLMCGYGLWTLTAEQARHFRYPLLFLALLFAYVAAQLVPLPPALWQSLPGRDFIAEIDRVAGLGQVWRPFTLTPHQTWNAFYSLFVPAAALLLAAQLSREDHRKLLVMLILCGVASGLLGILQITGPNYGPLYFYDITNNGFAVGLFSNRNHAAIFLACLFPMLVVFASRDDGSKETGFRSSVALTIGVATIPLILITGSRGGLLIALFAAVLSAFLVYHPQRQGSRSRFRPSLVVAIGLVSLAGLFALSSRAISLDRLVNLDLREELRFQLWSAAFRMGWKYFPAGSGTGSFVEVFKADEPESLLALNYANHAHNDWVELFMTGGVVAILLLAMAIFLWATRSYVAWRKLDPRSRATRHARLGSVLILLLAAASIADYPLRVPSLMCLLAIAVVWLHPLSTDGNRGKRRPTRNAVDTGHGFRYQSANS